MPPKNAAAGPSLLNGKIIVFTGALQMKRADATKAAEAAGATVTGSVSGKTDILVAGANSGSKIEDAIAKGVEIWDEEKFLEVVGSSVSSAVSAVAAPKKTKKEADPDDEDEAPPAKKKTAAGSSAGGELAGKKIVFTGTLQMKRAEATALAINAGASVSGAISGNTDILVAGADAGSKIEAAIAKGVEIWDEEQFVTAAGAGTGGPAAKNAAKKGKSLVSETDDIPVPAKKTKAAPAPKPAKNSKKQVEEDEGDDDEEEEEETPQSPPPKASTAAATASPGGGMKRPDRGIPNASSFTVYLDYTTKLMQTNVGHNNNKFYIIQVLEKNGTYYAYNRWGRLGEDGQSVNKPCSSANEAVALFEKKFREKTVNQWANRHSFVKHDGKYQLVEIAEDDDGGEAEDAALGKLSEAQIQRGQAVLEQIRAALVAEKRAGLTELSSQFYSLIPTKFGRKVPEPISSMEMLEAKAALLDFWLRMGFEDMKEQEGVTPITGVMDLPLPPTLDVAAGNITDLASIRASQSRAEQLVAAGAGSPVKKMDRELYASILLYTGNSIYAELNRVLRSENRAAVRKYFNYLRLFIEAMGCMPKKQQTLWRGISVDLFSQYEPGKVITWWGVSSCTADQQVARNFMAGCGGNCTLLTLETETAMDISALSFYSNERESLLAPGTQLKVLSRTRNGKISEIQVQEVGRVFG